MVTQEELEKIAADQTMKAILDKKNVIELDVFTEDETLIHLEMVPASYIVEFTPAKARSL